MQAAKSAVGVPGHRALDRCGLGRILQRVQSSIKVDIALLQPVEINLNRFDFSGRNVDLGDIVDGRTDHPDILVHFHQRVDGCVEATSNRRRRRCVRFKTRPASVGQHDPGGMQTYRCNRPAMILDKCLELPELRCSEIALFRNCVVIVDSVA